LKRLCIFLIGFLFPLILNSEDFTAHTLKQQNLRFQFPHTWRWNTSTPHKDNPKVFEAFAPGKKIILQIFAEPTKSTRVLKSFRKKQKQWGLQLIGQGGFANAEYPNLQHIGSYMGRFRNLSSGKEYLGFFLVGTDGLTLISVRLEAESSEFQNSLPLLSRILQSIETIFDWNHICCALCLKEVRYSARKTTVCTEFIVEDPCHQYLKNAKMDYEKCK
jgi:hypothetical protein